MFVTVRHEVAIDFSFIERVVTEALLRHASAGSPSRGGSASRLLE